MKSNVRTFLLLHGKSRQDCVPRVPRGRCTALLLLPPILEIQCASQKEGLCCKTGDDDVVNVAGLWLVLAVNLVRDTHQFSQYPFSWGTLCAPLELTSTQTLTRTQPQPQVAADRRVVACVSSTMLLFCCGNCFTYLCRMAVLRLSILFIYDILTSLGTITR